MEVSAVYPTVRVRPGIKGVINMIELEGKVERTFDLYDDMQIERLIAKIAGSEWWKYKMRVSYPKIEYEDFVQQGWLTTCELRSSNAPNDLNYFCVSVRNAMFRQVQKTATITYCNKRELWLYISGHEVRLDSPASDEDDMTVGEKVTDNVDRYQEVENKIMVTQVLSKLSDADKVEAQRIMYRLPPISKKRRETLPRRGSDILRGRNPYKGSVAPKKSDIPRVSYDKSKDRWVYYEKVDGKKKVLIRSRSQEEVEKFAQERMVV